MQTHISEGTDAIGAPVTTPAKVDINNTETLATASPHGEAGKQNQKKARAKAAPKTKPKKTGKKTPKATKPKAKPLEEGAVTQLPPVPQTPPVEKLTDLELEELAKSEATIRRAKKHTDESFPTIAKAAHTIRKGKLYRADYPSFEKYAAKELGFSRSHANRFAAAGEAIERLSPLGDVIHHFTTEPDFRKFVTLSQEEQIAVLTKIELARVWNRDLRISSRLVESAISQVRTPEAPRDEDAEETAQLEKIQKILAEGETKLPDDVPKEVKQVMAQIRKKVTALFKTHRTTGIDWAERTWNPLHGCKWASKGCDHCYAAKLMATRMADKYPGLAETKTLDSGKTRYLFTGNLVLEPQTLGEPLQDRVPKKWFVNSMSDLFHPDVPDAYIAAVFDVMEKASWHVFQVLTKRPERMAEWTAKRYADKAPPANVWLGTTTEDQDAFDKRLPELLKVKATVRWLSVEPLIGAIKMEKLDGIDWVVVGGESGSDRKMDIEWVRDIRDVCEEQGVAFFFKQWGDHDADGKKLVKVKKDGLTPPPLDGEIHDAYPDVPDAKSPVPTENPKPKSKTTKKQASEATK